MGEKSVGEKPMGKESVGEKHMGIKYHCTGSTAALAFVPPFQGVYMYTYITSRLSISVDSIDSDSSIKHATFDARSLCGSQREQLRELELERDALREAKPRNHGVGDETALGP